MNLTNLFKIAFKALSNNKLRGFLTMLGIIIGVGSVITMLAIGQGSKRSIQAQISEMGSNMIMIHPGGDRRGGVRLDAADMESLKLKDLEDIQAQARYISYISPSVNSSGQAIFGANNTPTTVYGISPEYLDIRRYKVEDGDIFSEQDVKTAAKVCLVGKSVVDELFPDPECKQFRKEDITSIELGIDFGGSQSGHSFVARGYTDDYREVIVLKSRRIMARDEVEEIDSNKLDQLFCEFIQEVIDQYAICVNYGEYVEYCNVESVFWDNAETVLGNSIRNAVERRFPWISVRPAKKKTITDRIRCTVRLMGAGRFFITDDCESLETALSDAVWNKDVKDKDERLDDGSTDIDSLDAFEYTIERDMKYLIQEAEDV